MATPRKTASGRWHVQIEIAGTRTSGTFPTKRDADAWAHKRSTELREQARAKPGSLKTLRETLRRYCEEVSIHKRGHHTEAIRLAAYETDAHRLMPLDKRIGDVTTADLALWRDARLKINARGSVLRDISLLSAVFERARREWQWIETNPVRDLRKPQAPDHRERIITRSEVRRTLRQLGHGRPVRTVSQAAARCFIVALRTGMRAGELCGLTWGDVREDYCVLPMTKNGSPRNVPLSPKARRDIERMRGWDSERVFGLGAQTLDTLFRRARTRAGLSGFCFHDARHTAATRMAQQVHLLDLCKIFGWKNTKQALVYFNESASNIAKKLR